MKRLILFSALIIGLLACKDNPVNDEITYPYRIGTFEVQSPYKAVWMGNTLKAKGDTTVISSIGQNELIIETKEDTENIGDDIVFTITDTTITDESTVMEAFTYMVAADNAFNTSSDGGGHNGVRIDFQKGYMTLKIFTDVNCNFSGTTDGFYTTIYANLDSLNNDSPTINYYFEAAGYYEAARAVDQVCN